MTIRVRWLGHAAWQVTHDNYSILIDPFLDDSPTSPVNSTAIDATHILITHGHFDHVADAAKIAKRTGATILAVFEIAQWFAKRHGAQHTIGMNIGGGINLPLGRVETTLAFHSSELPDGSYGGNPVGYLLRMAERTIYFAGDTALFGDMQRIGAKGIDLAVLPIGDLFTMGPDAALEAVQLLRPRRVVPSHYNTWPPIAQDAAAWAERVRSTSSAIPHVLDPGGTFDLD